MLDERRRRPRRGSPGDGLTALLYFSAGVTKKKTYPGGGEVLFRAAASTGALYQTELYVAAGDVDGLAPGLYHFCPGDFTLRQLRSGDVRAALAAAAAEPALARRAATLVLSAIFWRNTWKYQARGYRHLFWDSGTMLANTLAVGDALGLTPRVLTGFVDAEVNHCSASIVTREAALELVALGPEGPAAVIARPAAGAGARRDAAVERRGGLSAAPRDPRGLGLAAAPTRSSAWRRAGAPAAARAPRPAASPLPAPEPRESDARARPSSVAARPAALSHEPLSLPELSTALWAATPARGRRTCRAASSISTSSSTPSTAWRRAPTRSGRTTGSSSSVRARSRNESAYLTLEQALGGDAAATSSSSRRSTRSCKAWGDRGYRLANLEAGVAGGRAYLAAYAWASGPAGSRSTTPRSCGSSRRTRPGSTRSSSPRSAAALARATAC